jgi:taurine--2-oxoglutarate transaminase
MPCKYRILENVAKRGGELKAVLQTLLEKHPCVGDVRSIGLMGAVELAKDKKTKEPLAPYGKDPDGAMKKINGRLAERGFMTYTHENMILVAPPLIIAAEQRAEELAKPDAVLGIVDRELV